MEMAHPIRVKAKAMALLMLGNTVGHVAKRLNVPRQTVSRWKVDAYAFLRECVKTHPRYDELVQVGRMLALSRACTERSRSVEGLRGLHSSYKNGTKNTRARVR